MPRWVTSHLSAGDHKLIDPSGWGDGEGTVGVTFSARVCSFSEGDRFKCDVLPKCASRPGTVTETKKGKALSTPSLFSPQASVSCFKQKNNVCARAGFMSKTQRGFFTVPETGPAPGEWPCAGLDLRADVPGLIHQQGRSLTGSLSRRS